MYQRQQGRKPKATYWPLLLSRGLSFFRNVVAYLTFLDTQIIPYFVLSKNFLNFHYKIKCKM